MNFAFNSIVRRLAIERLWLAAISSAWPNSNGPSPASGQFLPSHVSTSPGCLSLNISTFSDRLLPDVRSPSPPPRSHRRNGRRSLVNLPLVFCLKIAHKCVWDALRDIGDRAALRKKNSMRPGLTD